MTVKQRGNIMNLKKKHLNKIVILFVLLNILMGLAFYSQTMESQYAHELAHKEIGENYRCLDYEIRQNHLTMSSEYECLDYLEGRDIEAETYLHSMNEIEGYNNQYIASKIQISTIFIVNMLFFVAVLLFIPMITAEYKTKKEVGNAKTKYYSYEKFVNETDASYRRGPYKK